MDIRHIESSELDTIKTTLADAGIKMYKIDCSTVYDKNSFFQAALHEVPLGDAELELGSARHSSPTWDAFDDFLWQGMIDRADKNVAIILLHTMQMAVANPVLLKDITRSFEHVAKSVSIEDQFINAPAISLRLYILAE